MRNQGVAAHSIKSILPWLVAIAFFMEALDTTILNTAVPTMAEALHVAPLSMKSVLSSYTLSLAVFIPISSWMADRFGTRRVFASAIGIFTLGSLLCGLSGNIQFLVFSRILQGCGGAMMVPVGRLTLVRTFAKHELVHAMNFVSIPALIGPMLGPLLGGVIVGLSHWRLIFFVNLPIGILGLYLVHRNLPDYRAAEVPPLDLIGLILLGSGISLLSYVLEVFGEHSLSSAKIALLLGIALALLATYLFHAKRISFPILRLELLRIRTLRAAVGGNFFTRLGAGGMPFLLPLLYQVGLGFTPVQSGLLILPQSLAAIVLRIWITRILHFFGYRKLLLINTAWIGLFIISFAWIGPDASIAAIVGLAIGFGMSSSLQYTSMNTMAYADVSEKDTGMASTIMSTVQQLSLSFGVATSSLVTAIFIPDRVHASRLDFILGAHRAFVALGVMTIISGIGFLQLKDTDGDNISGHHGGSRRS